LGMFLNPLSNRTDQQLLIRVGGVARYQPVPFDRKIGGRQGYKRDELGFNICPSTLTVGCRILVTGEPAGCLANLPILANRHHAPVRSVMR
jgi:hypothetical protein